MKRGIVFKLFMLTTALCMLILATIFIGQTLLFKQYYANRKVNDIKINMESFEKEYLNKGEDVQAIQKLEQQFYQKHTTWITTLDALGNIKHVNDFYLEILLDSSEDQSFSARAITIPLYSFMDLEDMQRANFYFTPGDRLVIDGIKKESAVVSSILTIKDGNSSWENRQLTTRLYGNSSKSEMKTKEDIEPLAIALSGTITKMHLPERGVLSNLIYTNRVFIERIKEFQANLVLNASDTSYASLLAVLYP